MKLLTDATTPFGRKAIVAARERKIALDETFVSIDAGLDQHNPLRQIPALVTDAGESLYDSDTILFYLDSLHDGESLFPGQTRFVDLTRIACANGLIEAVLQRTMESRRADGEKSESEMARLEQRAYRALGALEQQATALSSSTLSAADITTACALEYTDFRLTDAWREQAPALRDWLADVCERPSMTGTRPTRAG